MLIIKIIVCVIWVDLLYNVIYSELIGNIDISILPSVVLRDKVTNSSNNTHSQVYEGGIASCIHKKCVSAPWFPWRRGGFWVISIGPLNSRGWHDRPNLQLSRLDVVWIAPYLNCRVKVMG